MDATIDQVRSTHDAPRAVAAWLEDVPWQLFATFEFPTKATRPETANLKFAEMVNTVERTLRTRVCYVNASETRSRSGAPVPLHFHAAFAAARPIPPQLVAGVWNEGVGRTNSAGGDLARVQPYDPGMGGLGYIVKQIADQNCEWDCRNVDWFSNRIQTEPKTDHASLRAARSWQIQAGMAGAQVCNG
jgi:hypothetical protein